MSFTYSPINLSTDTLSQVRLAIGDTIAGNGVLPGGYNLEDAEINYYLSKHPSDLNGTLAEVFEMLANRYASIPDTRLGPRSETYNHIAAEFSKRAATYRELSGEWTGAVSTPIVRVDGYSNDIQSTETYLDDLP